MRAFPLLCARVRVCVCMCACVCVCIPLLGLCLRRLVCAWCVFCDVCVCVLFSLH